MKRINAYSLTEEILNCITHGFGLAMSLGVCIFFLVKGTLSDSWITTFSCMQFICCIDHIPCDSWRTGKCQSHRQKVRPRSNILAHCRQLLPFNSDCHENRG